MQLNPSQNSFIFLPLPLTSLERLMSIFYPLLLFSSAYKYRNQVELQELEPQASEQLSTRTA